MPHSAQTTLCIVRFSLYPPREPPELPFPELRCADLQPGQRLGSLVNPFSAKKACSEAVNANSAPQSRQVRVFSLYMMMYLQFIFPPSGLSFATVGSTLVSERWAKPGRSPAMNRWVITVYHGEQNKYIPGVGAEFSRFFAPITPKMYRFLLIILCYGLFSRHKIHYA